MIQTLYSIDELKDKLKNVSIANKEPLKSSAGFSDKSILSGHARHTFSLILSSKDIDYIQVQMQILYERICKDITFEPAATTPFPFDYIRIDAFYNAAIKKLSVLEINGRSAGMHEIGEYCDIYVAESLGLLFKDSLNDKIVAIQKKLQEAVVGQIDDLLYISKPGKPRWLYYEAVAKAYNKLTYTNSYEDITYTDNAVVFENRDYKAITAKASGGVKKAMWHLNDTGAIAVMQPRTTRIIGVKDYLNNLSYDFVPQSDELDKTKHDHYTSEQRSLVLKKIKSSGATGVIVGIDTSREKWLASLKKAYKNHESWQIQDYIKPGEGTVIGHDGSVAQNNKVLLGIFLVPDSNDPTKAVIDFSVKLYNGLENEIIFDPADVNEDIWFGNVVVAKK